MGSALGSSTAGGGGVARSSRENVRRSYLEQPWRYTGDVAGITGEDTRAAFGRRGGGGGAEGEVSGASFRLVQRVIITFAAGGRAGARRTAAAVDVDDAAPHRIVGSVVLTRLRRPFS